MDERYYTILVGRLAAIRDSRIIPTSDPSDSALMTVEKMTAYLNLLTAKPEAPADSRQTELSLDAR
jgi:hypothetical protein